MLSMYQNRHNSAMKMYLPESVYYSKYAGHDRFNYRVPGINYDKLPRKLKPPKDNNKMLIEFEAPSDFPLTFEKFQELQIRRRVPQIESLTSDQLQLLRNTYRNSEKKSLPKRRSVISEDNFVSCVNCSSSQKIRLPDVTDAVIDSIARLFGTACSFLEDPLVTNENSQSSSRQFVAFPSFDSLEETCSEHKDVDGTSDPSQLKIKRIIDMDSKVSRNLSKNSAALTCHYYLRSSGRYVLLEQLNDIGSRIDKNWFLVRDSNLKTDRLLTLVPQNDSIPVTLDSAILSTLMELFQYLQHPYIYPILDMDMRNLAECSFVITVIPFNDKGSLKDLIYRSRWQDEWFEKYQRRAIGLPITQVQRLGKQILEALIFLTNKGIPFFGHLHSGNIIVQNGVARLSGLENALLGYNSRIYSMIRRGNRRIKKTEMDVISFGYELTVFQPTDDRWNEIKNYPQVVEVLQFIFNRNVYPSLEELLLFDFFRSIDLRELRSLRCASLLKSSISPSVAKLLLELNRRLLGATSASNNFGLIDFSEREDSSVASFVISDYFTPKENFNVYDFFDVSPSTSDTARLTEDMALRDNEEFVTPPSSPFVFIPERRKTVPYINIKAGSKDIRASLGASKEQSYNISFG